MKNVYATQFPSETRSLKNENVLLWILLVLSNLVTAYQMWEYDHLKSSITPQAIYDACNKEQNNVRK